MKKSIVLLLIGTSLLCAQNNQELFLQANNAYQEGEFAKAFLLYEKIPNKSPEVWFNMGNAKYKQDNPVEAHVFWKYAELHANPLLNQAIKANIEMLQKKLSLEIYSDFWLIKNLKELNRHFSLIIVQLLFLLFWIMLLIIGYKFSKKRLIILFGIGLIVLILGLMLKIKYDRINQKIVIAKIDTNLYIGPSENFAQCGGVKKAQDLQIKEKSNGWFKVTTKNCLGWIPAASIIEI